MDEDKRKFIIEQLMKPGFITYEKQEIILEEKEESGRSKLTVRLRSTNNLCIANVDKKKTDIQFFQEEKAKSMNKRVDHIIFEWQKDNQWKLYLIEMKGSVGERKWDEIKGKFRASYLLGQAIAGILELEISETTMYTTFEKVQFTPLDTMPSARRSRSGRVMVRMEDEWNGMCFGLNFGKRISFMHIPIRMNRNTEGVLMGDLVEEK